MNALDQIGQKANTLAGEARMASRHIDNIADAAGQMRTRQNRAVEAIELLRVGDTTRASEKLQGLVDHCPSAESLAAWCEESQRMVGQVDRANAELQEAIEKAKGLEEARVTDPID